MAGRYIVETVKALESGFERGGVILGRVREGSIELDNGWLTLDLMVPSAHDGAQAIGALTVRALSPGPVPLAFTSSVAISGYGFYWPELALWPLAFVTLLVVTVAARDLPDYFIEWPQRGMTRFLYRADIHLP